MNDEAKEAVFQQLADLVRETVPDEMAIHEEPGQLHVRTPQPVTVNGKEKEMDLLSVIIQKRHIGFYFMPVYINPEMKATLPDDMNTMLKGKSCFHVKKELSPEKADKFVNLIQQGVALYREKAWIAG
jgi:hypothetical protein